jgi:hypothetical protein
MPTFNLGQLTGKTIYANSALNARSAASVDSTKLYTFKPGELVGVVFSAVSRPDGAWLMIDRVVNGTRVSFFVKASAAGIDVKKLIDQGAQTTQQEIKAEQEASVSTGEKIFGYIKKSGVVIGAALLALQFYKLSRNK